MTHRQTPPDRLPTLTDAIEYVDEVMTVVCIADNESLDARMRAALLPIFERAADEAVRAAQVVLAEALRESAGPSVRQPRAGEGKRGDTSA